MNLANFDDFKAAFERLQRETKEFTHRVDKERRKSARGRKAAGPLSPRTLSGLAKQLEREAAELARLSRAKEALRLRRRRAVEVRQRPGLRPT